MWEDRGSVVDYVDKARPVVLEGVDKRSESLINPLIYIFCLAVCLRVVGCRELELRA